MSDKVLVIEDDREIAELVKLHLGDIDCRVKLAFDGSTGLADAEANQYDLIILDITLPHENGLEICRRLRSRSNYTPILMLSSRATELDRVLGLEMGADDYLTKPFSVPELLARVKAIRRRVKALVSGSINTTALLKAHDLVIDREKRTVIVRGRLVEITTKEFDLLLHLARNPGRVYSREQLLDFVWGYNHDGYQHTVNSHINRLRGKIEQDPGRPAYVLTVWGAGYKFAEAMVGAPIDHAT